MTGLVQPQKEARCEDAQEPGSYIYAWMLHFWIYNIYNIYGIYIYVCILYIESSLIKRVINRIFLEIIIFMAVYTYTYVNLLGTYITRHLIFSCLGRQSFRSWVGHGCAVLVEDMFHVWFCDHLIYVYSYRVGSVFEKKTFVVDACGLCMVGASARTFTYLHRHWRLSMSHTFSIHVLFLPPALHRGCCSRSCPHPSNPARWWSMHFGSVLQFDRQSASFEIVAPCPAPWASSRWCCWRWAPGCWAPWPARAASSWTAPPQGAARWPWGVSRTTSMPGRRLWAPKIRHSCWSRLRTHLGSFQSWGCCLPWLPKGALCSCADPACVPSSCLWTSHVHVFSGVSPIEKNPWWFQQNAVSFSSCPCCFQSVSRILLSPMPIIVIFSKEC